MTILLRLAAISAYFLLIKNAQGFQSTTKFLNSLDALQQQASLSLGCYKELDAPRRRVNEFVTNSIAIYDGLSDLHKRCDTINIAVSTLMLIPLVNEVGALALSPMAQGLTLMMDSMTIIQPAIAPMISVMRRWNQQINSVLAIQKLHDVMDAAAKGKAHVSQVAEKISKLACGNTRSDRLGNIEAAAYGMDVVLNAANTELKKAYTACQDLKNVLLTTDFKLDTAVTTTMSLAKMSVEAITSRIYPFGEYLDEVDKVLDTKLCVSDVDRILKKEFSILKRTAQQVKEKIVGFGEAVAKKAKEFFSWKRRRRSLQRRDACVTVRLIAKAVTTVLKGFKAAAKFLLKEVFKKAMPKLPGRRKLLENYKTALASIMELPKPWRILPRHCYFSNLISTYNLESAR